MYGTTTSVPLSDDHQTYDSIGEYICGSQKNSGFDMSVSGDSLGVYDETVRENFTTIYEKNKVRSKYLQIFTYRFRLVINIPMIMSHNQQNNPFLQWGQGGNGSGPGSDVAYTAQTRFIVEMLIYRLRVRKFADAPCGAMKLQPIFLERVLRNVPCFRYYGYDVVQSVIADNIQSFIKDGKGPVGMKERARFQAADLSQGLPGGSYDMIFSRDTLQHLDFKTSARVLLSYWYVS